MAGYGQDRRLVLLETATPERPVIVVLTAQAGHEAAAVEAYYADTPEDRRAEVVVVVVRFGRGCQVA